MATISLYSRRVTSIFDRPRGVDVVGLNFFDLVFFDVVFVDFPDRDRFWATSLFSLQPPRRQELDRIDSHHFAQ
jgi:hypothetical protein